ncbi:hypothetical protein DS2_11858 [Catenovulum agarivorans DS-2]|uniref:Uncharacterized protein n=1 Tax=Catenovulum agarivorans DS-2 TaxID=1328313 RepID=W7QW59_9ALTE|nr:LamG domain-containing protein [Catenovulum agarivorans]EWH09525.1 hypothetical protein DS2_11858 [Catenovulum agarivorans DS-2]
MLSRDYKNVLCAASLVLLAACGGGEVEENPPPIKQPDTTTYQGPAPINQEVQNFKIAVWDNISSENRCGGCHTPETQQPYFASREDINQAFTQASLLVDLAKPEDSRLVAKVSNGHHCWLSSDQACGETMTQWIKLWSDDRVEQNNQLDLTAPAEKLPGSSLAFPDDETLFVEHIYPLTSQFCSNCHSPSAQFPVSPFFASSDETQAYQAAQKVINLDQINQSRLVVRLSQEFHNCWSNCGDNANQMRSAIEQFVAELDSNEIDENLLASRALAMTDGIVSAAEGRYESDLIALYEFKAGEGLQAFDTSGIEPAANLTFYGPVEWLGGWGINLQGGRAQASTAGSKKFHQLISLTGEFSIETWVTPANVVQEGPARIISYSANDDERNISLGQTQYNYDFMLRHSESDNNGSPALSTPDADEILQASLQHVVLTFDPINGQKIYVNSQLVADGHAEQLALGTLSNWDSSYALMLGNEATNNHPWLGQVRLLAVYNRALSEENITKNYDAGVGEKFVLLFSVGHLIDLADSYIMFEVSQFDNYSYLFATPKLVNLSGASLTTDLNIQGLRLAINGRDTSVGQSFINLDVNLASGTNLTEPVSLSGQASLLAIEKGFTQDEFFLTFDKIAEHTYARSEPAITEEQANTSSTEYSKIALRNFAEISASMSQLTGVSESTSSVANLYQTIKRQLPNIESIDIFVSAQQMAITQLGIAYCDTALNDEQIRSNWFGTFDFTQSPTATYADANRTNFIDNLLSKLMPLANADPQPLDQPSKSEVAAEINNLIDRLSQCATNGANGSSTCAADRSLTIAKASCTSVLASAATLLQ